MPLLGIVERFDVLAVSAAGEDVLALLLGHIRHQLALGAENAAGIVQHRPGAVFGGKQHAAFRAAGKDVLPLHPGIQTAADAPDPPSSFLMSA